MVRQNGRISKQDSVIAAIHSQLTSTGRRGAAEAMEVKERCSAQAAKLLAQLGYDARQVRFENHFNAPLGKCFLYVEDTQVADRTIFSNAILLDAHEGRPYARYRSMTFPGSGESRITECILLDAKGFDESCQDRFTFDIRVRSLLGLPSNMATGPSR